MSLMQSHSKSTMLIDRLTNPSATHATPFPMRLIARIVIAHGVWQQRRHLAALDATALDDIGLTRAQALREAQKPVWDVPRGWRR